MRKIVYKEGTSREMFFPRTRWTDLMMRDAKERRQLVDSVLYAELVFQANKSLTEATGPRKINILFTSQKVHAK